MNCDEDSFGVFCLLKSSHSFEPRIEETDVRLKPVRGGRDTSVDEVHESVTASLFEAHKDIVMNRVESEDVCFNHSFKVLPTQGESCWRCIE